MFQNSERDSHDDIIGGKFLTVVALDYGTGGRIIHRTPSYAIDRLTVSENHMGKILQRFLNVKVNEAFLPRNGIVSRIFIARTWCNNWANFEAAAPTLQRIPVVPWYCRRVFQCNYRIDRPRQARGLLRIDISRSWSCRTSPSRHHTCNRRVVMLLIIMKRDVIVSWINCTTM